MKIEKLHSSPHEVKIGRDFDSPWRSFHPSRWSRVRVEERYDIEVPINSPSLLVFSFFTRIQGVSRLGSWRMATIGS